MKVGRDTTPDPKRHRDDLPSPGDLAIHVLPGTRALRYFALAVLVLSAIEAALFRQPVILLGGVMLACAIAASSAWLGERHRPSSLALALCGPMGDLRMLWHAMTGQLPISKPRPLMSLRYYRSDELKPSGVERQTARPVLRRAAYRYLLLTMATFCLMIVLQDLDDLSEQYVLDYPLAQLGGPILAFAAACWVAARAIFVATAVNEYAEQIARQAGTGERWSDGVPVHRVKWPVSAAEESLWRAFLALLALGLIAFGLAELTEHGLPDWGELCLTLTPPLILIGASAYLVRRLMGNTP